MGFKFPAEIAAFAVDSGVTKAKLPLDKMQVLGFLAGAFIALGFLLDIRSLPKFLPNGPALPPFWGQLSSR